MSIIPNPYNPHQPTGDAAAFVGHQGVFAFFRQHFVGMPLSRPLVLIGRRGLGKSAVLHQLPYQLEERYRPCIVNLAALEHVSEAAVFAALVDAIRLTLESAEASTYRLPDWPAADPDTGQPPDLRAWFRDEYIDVALSALRLRHLVLCLDDAHLLLDAVARGDLAADWFAYLGDLLDAYERLDAMLALDAIYEGRMLETPLLNDPALHVRLSELTREEAERLVRAPVLNVFTYAPGVVEAILDRAGGHPFLLQAICFLLFRRSEERSHNAPVTLTDLDAIQPAVLDQADTIFDPLWQHATQNERLTLIALVRLHELDLSPEEAPAEDAALDDGLVPFAAIYGWLSGAGYTLTKTQLAAALRGLGYAGLVRAQADRYALAASVIADWVRANVTPPAPVPPRDERPAAVRWVPGLGLLAVVVIVAVLGIAALSGALGGDDDENDTPADSVAPTSTLSLNLEGTRQSEFATQTEQARPTETYTPTRTPRPSNTPSDTPTPTGTPTSTSTLTATITPTPTRTPRPTRTHTPDASPTPEPTATSEPTATLDPG